MRSPKVCCKSDESVRATKDACVAPIYLPNFLAFRSSGHPSTPQFLYRASLTFTMAFNQRSITAFLTAAAACTYNAGAFAPASRSTASRDVSLNIATGLPNVGNMLNLGGGNNNNNNEQKEPERPGA